MKKVIILLMVALMTVLGMSQQAAAYDVELMPQGSLDLNGQTTFLLDVWFNADTDGNDFSNWQFSLFYDTSELTWNSSNTVYGTMPLPLFPGSFSGPNENTSGHIELFDASKFPPNADDAYVTGSLLLATVAFDVAPGINMPAPDGAADVWFDTTSTVAGGFTIDDTAYFMDSTHPSGNIMPISGDTIDVVVTPEPISSILFVVGGATLGLRRFRKKRRIS